MLLGNGGLMCDGAYMRGGGLIGVEVRYCTQASGSLK